MTDAAVPQSKGRMYEGLAFTLCKAAFLMVLLQRFALPVTSLACAVAYLVAAYHGQKETRCWARYPLLIAGIWIVVSVATWTAILAPETWTSLKEHVGLGGWSGWQRAG